MSSTITGSSINTVGPITGTAITGTTITATSFVGDGSSLTGLSSTPIVHLYRLADIPSTSTGNSYATFTFTTTKTCTLFIDAQATVRQDNSTHDYCYLLFDDVSIAEASVSDRTYHWATNHAFTGIWVTDIPAGSHTVKIHNAGGGTSHGANDTGYDAYIRVQEV